MGLTVTYEHPDFEKGHEFAIAGLGLLKNGEPTEITDEQERAFVAFRQMSVRDSLSGNEAFTVAGTATVKASDLDDLLGVDVSDTPSPDPTAMNIGPDGKKFEHSNLTGARTDEWTGPTVAPELLEEVAAQVAATTDPDAPAANTSSDKS